MRCRILKYLYYLSYEQLLFKRKNNSSLFVLLCTFADAASSKTGPPDRESKKNLEPQQSRLLHMLIRGQILEDTLYHYAKN